MLLLSDNWVHAEWVFCSCATDSWITGKWIIFYLLCMGALILHMSKVYAVDLLHFGVQKVKKENGFVVYSLKVISLLFEIVLLMIHCFGMWRYIKTQTHTTFLYLYNCAVTTVNQDTCFIESVDVYMTCNHTDFAPEVIMYQTKIFRVVTILLHLIFLKN